MSSRRSRSGQPRTSSSRITPDQIAHLVSNLHAYVFQPGTILSVIRTNVVRWLYTPETHKKKSALHRYDDVVSADMHVMLQDACNYIKTLQGEVGDLSRRLCQLMQFTEDSDEAAFIRSLLNNGRS
ncbi:hypothetical protein OROHE_022972 [Orobanche hederae]